MNARRTRGGGTVRMSVERRAFRIGSGVYCVIVRLERTARIRVGRLGVMTFAPGTYVYTGRAARGLAGRLARHLRRRKPKRWHIDHLTTHRWARVVGIVVILGDATRECSLNRRVMASAQGSVPGFGASDCRGGCRSHLAYFAPREASRPVKEGER